VSIGAPATIKTGIPFDVYINIGQVTNLNSFQFDLAYDNPVIQIIGEEFMNGVTDGLIGSTVMPVSGWGFIDPGQKIGDLSSHTPGIIRVLGRFTKNPYMATGQGYLAQVHFLVVGAAGTNSKLSLSNVGLVFPDPADPRKNITISPQVVSGTVTVTN
jgi:hypothetical protein